MFFIAIFLTTAFSPTRSSACERLDLATHNDAFNAGLGDVPDDFRSFGWWAELSDCGPLALNFDFSGFTDRRSQTRLDSMWVNGKYTLFDHEAGTLSGGLGLWMTGRLGGEQTQNRVHRRTGHPEVFFPFDHDFKLRPSMGLDVRLETLRRAFITIGPMANVWIGVNHARTTWGTTAVVGSDNATVSTTISQNRTFIRDAPTVQSGFEQENGFALRIENRFSFLFIRWDTSLSGSRFGRGFIGATITPRERENRDFKAVDIAFGFGPALVPFESYWATYTLPIPVQDLAIDVHVDFGPYGVDQLSDFPGIRANQQALNLGLRYQPILMSGFFRVAPFGVAGFGVRADRFYPSTAAFDRVTEHTPELASRFGILFSIGGFSVLDRNARYGLSTFYGLGAGLSTRTIDLPTQSVTVGELRHTIGVGLNVEVDVYSGEL